jgi:capsular exopolysaccharide synthesis family protein
MRQDPVYEIESLNDFLRVLRRRKLAFLLSVIAFTGGALTVSLSSSARYQASAEVLLNRQNLATSLAGGANDAATYLQASRIAQTQADLARVPTIAERVLKAAGLTNRRPQDFLDDSSVTPERDADLLVFRVTDASRALALRLATEYAEQFSSYRRELDTASLRRAQSEVRARIQELKGGPDGSTLLAGIGATPEELRDLKTRLYTSLVAKEQQLRTLEAVQRRNALVVRTADEAKRVQPRPLRDGLVGFGFGVLLGIALAFLREGFDTRVRSAEEIATQLGFPLLARLKAPPRSLRKRNLLVTLAEAGGAQADAFRVLRTNLDFTTLERSTQAIMVTSAVGAEGTSTTAANLAVMLARSGRRTILADLNLKRPYLHRLFPLRPGPGVTDVALGHGRLENALTPVAVVSENGNHRAAGNGAASGGLAVVTAGRIPPDDGELLASPAVAAIVEELRTCCDVLVIDAPPLLEGGDGLTVAARVDGLVLVTRLDVIRRAMLHELARVLRACPTTKLGFVLTGAQLDDSYPYVFGEDSAKPLTRAARALAP